VNLKNNKEKLKYKLIIN